MKAKISVIKGATDGFTIAKASSVDAPIAELTEGGVVFRDRKGNVVALLTGGYLVTAKKPPQRKARKTKRKSTTLRI